MNITPVLTLPDFNKPFELATDTCDTKVDVVLMQERIIYEKELKSVVMVVTKWRSYMMGNNFIIFTYHQRIKYFMEQRIHIMLQKKMIIQVARVQL